MRRQEEFQDVHYAYNHHLQNGAKPAFDPAEDPHGHEYFGKSDGVGEKPGVFLPEYFRNDQPVPGHEIQKLAIKSVYKPDEANHGGK
jgi:hypothetical protein